MREPDPTRADAPLRRYAAQALRAWEPRRALSNAVLLAVVGGHFLAAWPSALASLSANTLLWLFFLGVLANLCYCAVYPIDLFVRFAGLESAWRWGQVAVLAVGTAFAATLAHFLVAGLFRQAD